MGHLFRSRPAGQADPPGGRAALAATARSVIEGSDSSAAPMVHGNLRAGARPKDDRAESAPINSAAQWCHPPDFP